MFRGSYRDELIEIETFTMVTTTPNELVRPIHPDRMPMVLHRDSWNRWLSGTADGAMELARPFPAEAMHIVRSGEDEKADPGAAGAA